MPYTHKSHSHTQMCEQHSSEPKSGVACHTSCIKSRPSTPRLQRYTRSPAATGGSRAWRSWRSFLSRLGFVCTTTWTTRTSLLVARLFGLFILVTDMPQDTDHPYLIRIFAGFKVIRPYSILIRILTKLMETLFLTTLYPCMRHKPIYRGRNSGSPVVRGLPETWSDYQRRWQQ